ncbi:MAG: 30S ribosomal protein S12 methylthiotransferase RimO [Candidatus Omnitrophica bacterium]|nr:30S ribosomal protein S12 methylthiotransferase RimO [Candidatus Omnitrophota bacterium]MDD5487917.1 30S ribosomal protein S12 methylthiotransferase RimO [Candidatus Omnitrophota bacterium]
MLTAYLLSLGCPRNMIDSEVLLGLLEKKGVTIAESPEGTDIAIVNTCGFINDAKQESINYILELAEMKKLGDIKKLVVCGCLPQRYPLELREEIKEIDAIFGTADFIRIPDLWDRIMSGRPVNEVSAAPDFLYDHTYPRKLIPSKHFTYVKIQEGCSNRCSYCVIPDLKGPRRSRIVSSVEAEVKALRAEHGVREVILIGQDTTSFGMDRGVYGELAVLLRKLSPLVEDGWLRLLYTHPAHITEEIINIMADTPNICNYLDLPIQHISDRVLNDMNRRVTMQRIRDVLGFVRRKVPEVIIRTSVIAGFPGETENEFRQLMDFLREVKFDRLGAFVYSREEGTPAAKMSGQVPEKVKMERMAEIMALQQEISAENNMKYIGRTYRAIVDEIVEGSDTEYIGRTYMDAPEVDGVMYIRGKGLSAGDMVDVRVTGSMEYDLIGEVA